MPNTSQIGQDMAILAHLAKLTDQLTNQPLAMSKMTLTAFFEIWGQIGSNNN